MLNPKTNNMTDFKQGYVPNEVYKVETFGNTFKLIDTAGNKVGTLGATTGVRKSAYQQGMAVQLILTRMVKNHSEKLIWMYIIPWLFR